MKKEKKLSIALHIVAMIILAAFMCALTDYTSALISLLVYVACVAIREMGKQEVTFTYADGKRETERFADIVEQARLYILTDCGGSFERFAEWGLVRTLAQV